VQQAQHVGFVVLRLPARGLPRQRAPAWHKDHSVVEAAEQKPLRVGWVVTGCRRPTCFGLCFFLEMEIAHGRQPTARRSA
jgi:hypothetical protein